MEPEAELNGDGTYLLLTLRRDGKPHPVADWLNPEPIQGTENTRITTVMQWVEGEYPNAE